MLTFACALISVTPESPEGGVDWPNAFEPQHRTVPSAVSATE
jgi:hypothetical protein